MPEEEEDDGRSGDANHRARLVRQEHVQIGDDSWAPDVEASAKPLGNGRRASYEHQRPRAGRELRRCRSEVSAPSDALPVEQPALAHQSNPLAAKDKIQANILAFSSLAFTAVLYCLAVDWVRRFTARVSIIAPRKLVVNFSAPVGRPIGRSPPDS